MNKSRADLILEGLADLEDSIIVDRRLLDKCRKVYNETYNDIMSGTNADVSDNIKNVFKKHGGRVNFSFRSPEYLEYDGRIGTFTIGGSIYLKNLTLDVRRLAEDITMAYFRNSGGTEDINTPELMSLINGTKEKFRSNIIVK